MYMEIIINLTAVAAAAIANMFVGAMWYGPLFGKRWMALVGMNPDQMEQMKKDPAFKKKAQNGYFWASISSLVMAYVLANFVFFTGADSVRGGLQLAFWIWLGFFVPVVMSGVLWENKSVKLFALQASHYLVALAIMGVILAVWQ